MPRHKLWTLTVIVSFCLSSFVSESNGQDPVEAPADWFAKSAKGVRTTPRADYGEPASGNDFYLWSWNEFLWLTQPSDANNSKSEPKFLSLAPAHSLFPPTGDPPPYSSVDAKQLLDAALRSAKRDEDHAGGEHGVSQAGSMELLVDSIKGGGNPIYYTMQVNKEFYSFVRSNKLYKKSVLSKLSPDDEIAQFPNGAVEIKSSWMITKKWKPGEDPKTTKPTVIVPNSEKRFFVMLSEIGAPEPENGHWVESSHEHWVELALIGMHVVGKVDKHPELNWATFEHIDNAPDHSTLPSSETKWALYKAGTPANECNIGLDPNSPLRPTPVSRMNPDGLLPSTDAKDPNKKAINELNASVVSQLAKNFPDSPWQNYRLVGALWTDGKLPVVSSGPSANEFGSLYLSNSTMESFTQFGVPNKALATKNCFTCHNTKGTTAPANLPVSVSHLITNFAQNDIVQSSLQKEFVRLRLKEDCFSVPAAVQKQISQGPDYWRQCMLGATNNQIDLWNSDSVVGNASNIDQHLQSQAMPPKRSGGPLPKQALKIWNEFYARVQFELVIKPRCLTVPQSTQKSLNLAADAWHVCMRDNMGLDIWNFDSVIKNAKMINGKLHNAGSPMPPKVSGGPLSKDALATWDKWYDMVSKRGVIPD